MRSAHCPDNKTVPAGYRRSLDYATGAARVQYTDADTRYQQRTFISRPDNAVVLELTAVGAKGLRGEIAVTAHPPCPKDGPNESAGPRARDRRQPPPPRGRGVFLRRLSPRPRRV